MIDKCPKCGGPKRGPKYEQCRKCFLKHYKTRTTKLCKKCNRELPLDAFRTRPDYCTSYGTRRPRSRCKECEADGAKLYRGKFTPEEKREKKREYYRNNPEKARRTANRRSWRRMGLDPDVVELYIKTHPNVCEICGLPGDNGKLAVDHCHEKKIFRGLLCSKCNLGIGLYKDSPELLKKAAEYLECHAHVAGALGPQT